MAAIALLKFVQGATTGPDGEALYCTTGTQVDVSNVSNVDVASWQIDLLYTPPGSGVAVATPLAFSNTATAPAASFTPDVAGCFRVRLTVYESAGRVGVSNVDIRNVIVRTSKHGWVLPPFQDLPLPLPLLGSSEPGEKPNELNVGGQALGWHGGNSDGLLHNILKEIDESNFDIIPDPDTTNQVFATFNIGYREPMSVVVGPVGDLVFTNSNFVTVFISMTPPGVAPEAVQFDSSDDAILSTASFSTASATSFDLTATDTKIWASLYDGVGASLVEITPGDPIVAGSPAAVGAGMLLGNGAFDGTDMWYTNVLGGTLVRINAVSPSSPTATLSAGGQYYGCAADLDTDNYADASPRIWSADNSVGDLARIELSTPAVDATVDINAAVASEPLGVAVGGGYVWCFTTDADLVRVTPHPAAVDDDASLSGTFVRILSAGYDETNDKVWLLGINSSDNMEVARITPATLAVEDTVELDSSGANSTLAAAAGIPFKFAFDNGFVWVTDPEVDGTGNGTLYKINLTGSLTATAMVPTLSSGFASPGGDISGGIQNAVVVGLQNRAVSGDLPDSGDILAFTGSSWEPFPVSGDVSLFVLGSAIEVRGIRGETIEDDDPSVGEILQYTGSEWSMQGYRRIMLQSNASSSFNWNGTAEIINCSGTEDQTVTMAATSAAGKVVWIRALGGDGWITILRHDASQIARFRRGSAEYVGLFVTPDTVDQWSVITPLINEIRESITADQDDYDPTGWAGASHVLLTTDASRTVTGFAAPAGSTNRQAEKVIINVGAQDLVIAHENVASAEENRVITTTAADITLGQRISTRMYYDFIDDRWRVIS